MHCNIRSARKHLDHLVAYLSQYSYRYDVIALTETWLKQGESVEIPGYDFLSLPRDSTSRGGGVALFVRKELGYCCCHNISHDGSMVESLFIQLKCGIIIGVVYRPPNTCLTKFYSVMESILLLLTAGKSSLIVCGDFDIDLLKGNSCDYLLLLQSLNLTNVIAEPTRTTNQSASLIDHVLCSRDTNVFASVCDVSISDHNPTFVLYPCDLLRSHPKQPRERTTRVDYLHVRSLLRCTDFESIYNDDIDIEYQNLMVKITNAIDQSTRAYTRHNYDHGICPWMTKAILEVLKKKDSYYHRWKNNRTNNYYREQSRYYRNKSVAMMRNSKKQYYSNRIIQQQGNSRRIWRIVRDVVGLRKKEHVVPDVISEEVANISNIHFVNWGRNLVSRFPSTTHCLRIPRLTNDNFVFREITEEEIKAVIKSLPENKACGHDGIPAKVLRDSIDILSVPLCKIFNHAMATSKYPINLKTAKVVPVYKTGDPNDPNSYRPISVLSIINALFEKLIALQFNKFLLDKNVICAEQHGFVSVKSTSTAVTSLSQHINTALHTNQIAIVIFLDIKKAFECVCHSELKKLEACGVNNDSLQFFTSYLSARKQKVVLNNRILHSYQ